MENLQDIVLGKSKNLDAYKTCDDTVKGYDFNEGINYKKLLQSYSRTGFQATNMGCAIDRINEMIAKRNEPLTQEQIDHQDFVNPIKRKRNNCTIFLGATSNMSSAGTREHLRFLAEHNLIDVMVMSAGGIEEDFIKCLAPTYVGDFSLAGEKLRKDGINRIGNLLVPNDNYVGFEKWIMPIFTAMLNEQKEEGINWTPSKMIRRLGKEINDKSSIFYWCYKNDIPVFSPAITDGSIGDMLFFFSVNNPELKLDIIEDVRLMNLQAVHAQHTGMIIIGGGLVKHHISNANLMRNGADYSVFINTAQPFDGSDAGATPDEAVSWGKIKMSCKPVKIYAEATLVLPLIIAETFADDHWKRKQEATKKKLQLESEAKARAFAARERALVARAEFVESLKVARKTKA